MWMMVKKRSESEGLDVLGVGICSSCLCSHDAVLWIFEVLDCESCDVIDTVRKRISSRISAAARLKLRVSRLCANVVGDERNGLFKPSE